MDTSRKTITKVVSCHYCIFYKATMKDGKKQCYGHCKVTGRIKNRTDDCKKYFKNKQQIKFDILNP